MKSPQHDRIICIICKKLTCSQQTVSNDNSLWTAVTV